METNFEQLIDFTFKKEQIQGKTRVIFLNLDQWKALAKEKNDLAQYYEELKKGKISALLPKKKETLKSPDYYHSLSISIKEPKQRFVSTSSRQRFFRTWQLCFINRDADLLIFLNPQEFPKLSLEAQYEVIVCEILHYEEHRSGKLYPQQKLKEKTKEIVKEFLNQL
mgnify:CR=1 FL=1